MNSKTKKFGKIIVEPGVHSIYPFEMHSAIALKEHGFTIRFVPAHNSISSADAYIDDVLFEFKSPEGKTIKCIENNLQKALRYQSKNIVLDSCRVKNLQDNSIENYLISRVKRKKGIRQLFFVTKSGKCIDINAKLR